MRLLALAALLTFLFALTQAAPTTDATAPTPASAAADTSHPAKADSSKPIVADSVKKAPIYQGDTLAPDAGVFIIETHHRMFTDFKQIDTVRFGQKFQLGDQDMWAQPILFNPNVSIYTDGSAMRESDTLYNPGLRLRVTQADSTLQESWAFYYMDAPHFRKNALFAFKIVDYKLKSKKYIPAPPKTTQGK